ncbi:MAG TPA: cob(I)yrinic acid a,c-diamide adenosyltransferase [Planctomycetes bacterium]|nr:cob(I)yrinic acid a,c-diamide adenosyltransferase [Planctomycetota bacterium]HIL37792.1 cob(I)yrinic acid a,c-diamide adenosyltransferase [Planctomycetota bacterium]
MVHLGRIYTKTGDDGFTALGDGTRVPKDSARVAAYGDVDECSSALGLALAQGLSEPWAERLTQVQNDLFDVGSDLCRPGDSEGEARIGEAYVERLEGWIDEANQDLPDLTSFILPGGTLSAGWLHLARTICRRAERSVVTLFGDPDEAAQSNPKVLLYLNRLSDLLFVLARRMNHDSASQEGGEGDVLWRPAGKKEDD